MTGDPDQYEALAPLLPFFVNGTLAPEDQERVKAGLAQDAMLREELEEIRAIATLVQQGGPALTIDAGASADDRLAALLTRIDAETPAPAATTVVPPLPRPRQSGPWQSTARGEQRRIPRAPGTVWKPAFAVAAALAVAQFGFIGYQMQADPQNTYTSLSGPAAPQTPPPAAQHLLVKLAPDARWADVADLLANNGLAIVGGPHAGMLDIAVSADTQRDKAVQALKASPLIAFVGVAS